MVTATACPITVWPTDPRYADHRTIATPCGRPANDPGLCDKHHADRVRLGGGK